MATKGFITVATGKWYCYLAQNLVMSYRLFANCDLPFYVITDKKCEKKLKKYFDGVIVVENPHYDCLDKIDVYKNTPFDETIFLDADMNIIKDISFIFDEFEKNGSEVSCYGTLRDITDEVRSCHYGDAAVENFNLKQCITFGGGMYYYKKSPVADNVIDCIYNDLIPNYDKLELHRFRGGHADEPLMEVAMLQYGMKPYNGTQHLMRFYSGSNMMKTIKWDLEKRDCSFYWWGETVHPYIVHYATGNTYTYRYLVLIVNLKNKYYKLNTCFGSINYFFSTLKWALKPRQLKRFFKWFGWHFTPSYWKEKLGK